MPALQLSVDLLHPQDQVWRALTENGPLNEWFQPLTGWPATGATEGTVGHVFPSGELHSFAPFEFELLALGEPNYLIFQWRGKDFLSEVTFELTPTQQGCRLKLRQTGFLGSREALRRAELLDGYQLMLAQRLPAALNRLAGITPRPATPPPRPVTPQPPSPQNRLQLLSFVGALALVVLCASAGAVWINSDAIMPATGAESHGLGSGQQPGTLEPIISASASPSSPSASTASPSPSASTLPLPASGVPLTATYRTLALLGLGGFDTEVTVRNPSGVARTGWTVTLTMPSDNKVQNRSPGMIGLQQTGQTVILTPIASELPGNGSVTFVVRFPALLALGQSVTACTIDGRPCGAG